MIGCFRSLFIPPVQRPGCSFPLLSDGLTEPWLPWLFCWPFSQRLQLFTCLNKVSFGVSLCRSRSCFCSVTLNFHFHVLPVQSQLVASDNCDLFAETDEQQFKSWMSLVGWVEPLYQIRRIKVFAKLFPVVKKREGQKITSDLFLHSTIKSTAWRSSTRDCRYSMKTRWGLINTMRENTLSKVRIAFYHVIISLIHFKWCV